MIPQVWIPLVTGIVTAGLGSLFQLWLFRKLNRDSEVSQLRQDVNSLRGAVKYLEGRMNGKHWRSEA